jgi:hypothetical protein
MSSYTPAPFKPWTAPDDDEYSRLTLDEKIRTHLILADQDTTAAIQLLVKADKTRNITSMPEAGKALMSRANNHREEAGRLRKLTVAGMQKREFAR